MDASSRHPHEKHWPLALRLWLMAAIFRRASPSRFRGTTPSWTIKSGLKWPTAEKTLFRPFHIWLARPDSPPPGLLQMKFWRSMHRACESLRGRFPVSHQFDNQYRLGPFRILGTHSKVAAFMAVRSMISMAPGKSPASIILETASPASSTLE